MDVSYATIPTCEGNFVTLHREPIMRYLVEDPNDPMNELVCNNDDFGNLCVLANSLALVEEETLKKESNEFDCWGWDCVHFP